MTQYQTTTPMIEATQWFKNGDHPEDEAVRTGADGGFQTWEGKVVRYYRHPGYRGESRCPHCQYIMHDHGWIDSGGDGKVVCPGDFVVTTHRGHHPMKPEAFMAIFGVAEKQSPPGVPNCS